MLAIFDHMALEPRTVVVIGMLFGPARVAARLCEFLFTREVHPLLIARGAAVLMLVAFLLLALFGVSPLVAAAFAILFGACNGLITIATGTVPLALFGAGATAACSAVWVAPSRLLQAAAPLAIAIVIERYLRPGRTCDHRSLRRRRIALLPAHPPPGLSVDLP